MTIQEKCIDPAAASLRPQLRAVNQTELLQERAFTVHNVCRVPPISSAAISNITQLGVEIPFPNGTNRTNGSISSAPKARAATRTSARQD